MYLAYRGQLHRKYFNLCPKLECSADKFLSWSNNVQFARNTTKKERVVVSYGHNGFGNQLWEHSVAFMIAKSLNAR